MKQARKKSGNLSSGGKEPPLKPGVGLDWAAIMRCHRPEGASQPVPPSLQLDLADIDRRNRGVNTYYGPDKEQQREAARRGGKRKRAAPFDVDEVIRMYVEDKTGVAEIALKVQSSQETVRKYLRRAEVYDANRDKHRPHRPEGTYKKKDRCIRDHDLTVEGARYKNGACRECKRERGYDNVPWSESPLNPKNGGKRPALTPEQRERQSQRQRELRAEARHACPTCDHAALKHNLKCEVRDCNCLHTNSDVKALWAQIKAGE